MIPKTALPGIYRAHGVAILESTIGKRYVKWATEPFEVIPKVPEKVAEPKAKPIEPIEPIDEPKDKP